MSMEEYLIMMIELPRKGGGNIYIPLRFITYIEIRDGLLNIHFVKDVMLSYDRNMCDLKDVFPEPHFRQCHESYIANIHYVLERIPGDGGKLVMYDQAVKGVVEIPISRVYKDDIIMALKAQSITLPGKKVALKPKILVKPKRKAKKK